jgi:hypothetical protein
MKCVQRSASRLDSYARAARSDIGPHHRIGHLHRTVLVQQPVEHLLDGVPLLARRVQIRPQHLVDHRLERIQPRLAGRQLLARLRPDGLHRRLHRPEAHPYLRCTARFDIPAPTSRRIAAYRTTSDFGGTGAPSPRRALPASHRKHPSGVKLSDITLRRHRAVSSPIDNRCQDSPIKPPALRRHDLSRA